MITFVRSVFCIVVATAAFTALTGCSTAPKTDEYASLRIKQTDRGVQITSDEKVLFDTGKSEVKAEGQGFLDLVAKALKERTKANVLVEGHTDNVGAAAYNKTLSEQRAASVREGLLARGIATSRVQSAGLGLTTPVADNATPEGRQANRRTDIIVLGETVESMFPKK